MPKIRDFNLRFRVENASFDVRVFGSQYGLLIDNEFRESFEVSLEDKKVTLLDQDAVATWAETQLNNGDGFDVVRVLEKLLTDFLFCPHCGTFAGEDKFEDNGCSTTSVDYTLLCENCTEQWSPNDW